MKYTTTIEIEKPLQEVITLFDNKDNYFLWMEGLQRYDLISGPFGQEGTQAELEFKLSGRKVLLKETVIKRDFPGEYSVNYIANGADNLVTNRFEAIDENRTRYHSENTFKFRGFMKFFALIMPGSFKKQSLKYQNDFKRFVEHYQSTND
ncbi:MAG: hypothetical protein Roseis2KO_22800 [Roseivirga sp.]